MSIPPPPPGFTLDTSHSSVIPPPPPGFTLDRAPAAKPAPKGQTSAPTQPSSWLDSAKSALSALPQAVEGMAGLPGAIQGGVGAGVDAVRHTSNSAMRYAWNHAHGGNQTYSDASNAETAQDAAGAARVQQAARKSGPVGQYLHALTQQHLPTTGDISGAVDGAIKTATGGKYTGLYTPTTAAGRTTQSILGSTLAAVTGGEGTLLPRLLTGAAAGATGSAARETVHAAYPGHPVAETLADMAGNVVGGGAAAVVNGVRNMRATVLQRGKADAAKIYNESLIDPDAARASLHAHNTSGAPQHKDFNPTSSQVIGTTDAADLERAIANKTGDKQILLQRKNSLAASGSPADAEGVTQLPMGSGQPGAAPKIFAAEPRGPEAREELSNGTTANHKAEMDAAVQAKTEAVQAVGDQKAAAMEAATGATPNMISDAGAKLQSHLADVHEAMGQKNADAWQAVTDSGVTLPGEKVRGDVNDYLDRETAADPANSVVLNKARGALSRVSAAEYPDDQIPIGAWQGLRSHIGSVAALDPDLNSRRLNGGLVDLLGKHLDGAGVADIPEGADPSLWGKAVDAHKDYKSVFSDTPAGASVATNNNGLINPPEKTISNLLSGKKGAQNVRALYDNPAVDDNVLNDTLGQHYVGTLTKNGMSPNVGSADVDKLLQNPQTASLAAETGVGDRLASIRETAAQHEDNLAAVSQQQDEAIANLSQRHARYSARVRAFNNDDAALEKLQNGFNNAYAKGPDKFNEFMNNNKEAVLAAANPEHAPYIEQLHDNAKLLSQPEGEQGLASPTLGAVTSGDPNALTASHFGPGVARAIHLGSRGLAVAAIPLESAALGVPSALRGLTDIGLFSKAKDMAGVIKQASANYLNGDSASHTMANLSDAMRDPVSAESLLNLDPNASTALPGTIPAMKRSALYAGVAPSPVYPTVDPADTPKKDDTDAPADALSEDAPVVDAPPVEYPPEGHASGGRTTFKTGGQVVKKDIEHLVQRLISKADKARKLSILHTKPLLNHHDSTIISALNVAKRAI